MWNGQPFLPTADQALKQLLQVAYYCNNAYTDKINGEDIIQVILLKELFKGSGHQAGLGRGERQRIREYPFDSERKMMMWSLPGRASPQVLDQRRLLEALLPCCSMVMAKGGVTPIRPEHREKLRLLQDEWAQQAMRVLGFAFRDIGLQEAQTASDRDLESNLILLGICGIVDPPRPGVVQSVQQCTQAGIIPVMITGDHPFTARAIAEQVGIGGEAVITGAQIDQMSDHELYRGAIHSRYLPQLLPSLNKSQLSGFCKDGSMWWP